MLEDQIGFKCEETFLEDSAIKLIKNQLKNHDCHCTAFKYIIVDLDDPTLIIQRFVNNVQKILSDNHITIPIYGCSGRDSEKTKQSL